MYILNYNKHKKRISLILIGIGLLLLIIFLSIKIYQRINYFDYNATNVIKIEEIFCNKKECKTKYNYKVLGSEYTCINNHKSNENIYLYYNINSPEMCKISKMKLLDKKTFIKLLILPFIFIYTGMIQLFKYLKTAIKYMKLNKVGILFKNQPYHMVETGYTKNGKRVFAPRVIYIDYKGWDHRLTGEPRFDFKEKDDDGFVDLLIDPKDISNYFIDFNIEPKKKKNLK